MQLTGRLKQRRSGSGASVAAGHQMQVGACGTRQPIASSCHVCACMLLGCSRACRVQIFKVLHWTVPSAPSLH